MAALDLLADFRSIEGRRPAAVEPGISRLVDALLGDADLRALVTEDWFRRRRSSL